MLETLSTKVSEGSVDVSIAISKAKSYESILWGFRYSNDFSLLIIASYT
jgi:hypothetical protein